LILGLMGVVLLSSYFVIRRIPDVYESRAVVVVADHEENGLVTSGQVAAVSEQMTSRATLEPIIRKYGLYRPILDHAGMDLAVAQMRKAISVDTTFRREFPESLTIVFRDSDPNATRGVLEDLVANFYAANEAIRRQAETDMASVNGEIAAIDQQLDGLDRVRSDTARRTAASRREFDAMAATRAQRAATASTIDALASRQQLLTAQVGAMRQQVKDQEELVASLPATPVTAGALAVRRAELQARLNEFAGQYTDKNPKVISAREELAEIDRQMAAAESGAAPATQRTASPEAAELRTLRRDLAGLETELDVTTKEIERRRAGAPQVPVESALARSAEPLPAEADGGYDRLRIRYQALMNRQDALERALPAAFVGQGVFRVVDTPATPDTPIGPNRFMLVLFALGLAIGIALAVAAVLEARRVVRIHDALDVSYFLGAPVLAAIPETLTPVEAHSRRSMRLLRGAGLAVLAVALVPALFGLMSALQIFEVLARR
jgi:capsular polysaccharide biosynthesis protein